MVSILTGSPFSGRVIFSGAIPSSAACRDAGTASIVSGSSFHSDRP